MSYDANNVPTNDVTFEPTGPSDLPSIIADVEVHSAYAEDDPARAVDELIIMMAQQRKQLMTVLAMCVEPTSFADVKAEMERLYEFMPSVYTAADFCALLEEAGGITCVTADGQPYDLSTLEPSIVEENGARYYVANEPDDMCWLTTDAGAAILADDDPLGRAQTFFDEDPDLLPIYKRVLLLCDGGVSLDVLNESVNDDPLVQSPRIYAPFFIDRLERADAIEWEHEWLLTEIGREALALLDDVDDDFAVASVKKGA